MTTLLTETFLALREKKHLASTLYARRARHGRLSSLIKRPISTYIHYYHAIYDELMMMPLIENTAIIAHARAPHQQEIAEIQILLSYMRGPTFASRARRQ